MGRYLYNGDKLTVCTMRVMMVIVATNLGSFVSAHCLAKRWQDVHSYENKISCWLVE